MKSSMRILGVTALAGASLFVIGAGFRAEEKPDGAALFKQKCSMCHGPEGKGFQALKTPDFTDPKWQEGITDKQIAETIKNGKKGTPMPPFAEKLNDDEIQALVAHIRSLNSDKKK